MMYIKIDNSRYVAEPSLELSKHRKGLLEDTITLNTATQHPAGASIFCDGEEFTAIESGEPDGERYNQTFYSPFDYKCRTSTLPEWHIDGTPEDYANMLYYAINSNGLRCFVHVGDMSAFKERAEITFSGDSLYSAIRKIQEAFRCKMWIEKITIKQGEDTIRCRCLHFSEYSLSFSRLSLCSPANIQTPSVKGHGEYYNRFYIFGSSRNITQDYQGANVNNVATKRLTLNPTQHPEGYLDYSNGAPVYSKILQFDDIYPSATDLVITDLRFRYMYEIGEDGKMVIIGEQDGEPIYSRYAIWYMQLKRLVGGSYVDFPYNDTIYDKDDNPDGMRLPGLTPSFHFNSGPLAGREFEVIYHKDGENIKEDEIGNPPFVVLPGDFEIKYQDENGFILPAVTGLVPQTDNLVVLFNIRMPDAYIESAQDRLEERARMYIGESYIQMDENKIPYVDGMGHPLFVDKAEYTAKLDPVSAYYGNNLQTPITELNIIPTE